MKLIKTFLLAGGMALPCLVVVQVQAQTPAAIAGSALSVAVTSGGGIFPSSGRYLFLPADSGSAYQLIGVAGMAPSSGTYGYSISNGPGSINLADNAWGSVGGNLSFNNSLSGNIALTGGTNSQNGNFAFAAASTPNSLAGHSYYLTAQAGAPPFASQGSAIFTPASSGNTYSVVGTGNSVQNSSGNYSFSKVNAATGVFVFNDAVTGTGTEYFAFQSATSGIYFVTQPASGGFQVGTFTSANVVPAAFFNGQTDKTAEIDFLQFPGGRGFGYYNVVDFSFPIFYHYDLGFECFFDANNAAQGVYLYDFASATFFYTDPATFPYLYDFTLNTWLYYYPNTQQAGHYTTNPRYFYNFNTSKIITK